MLIKGWCSSSIENIRKGWTTLENGIIDSIQLNLSLFWHILILALFHKCWATTATSGSVVTSLNHMKNLWKKPENPLKKMWNKSEECLRSETFNSDFFEQFFRWFSDDSPYNLKLFQTFFRQLLNDLNLTSIKEDRLDLRVAWGPF